MCISVVIFDIQLAAGILERSRPGSEKHGNAACYVRKLVINYGRAERETERQADTIRADFDATTIGIWEKQTAKCYNQIRMANEKTDARRMLCHWKDDAQMDSPIRSNEAYLRREAEGGKQIRLIIVPLRAEAISDGRGWPVKSIIENFSPFPGFEMTFYAWSFFPLITIRGRPHFTIWTKYIII